MSDPTDEFDAPGDAADEFAPEAAIEDARGPAADEVPVEAEAIESDAAESVEPVEPVAPAEFVEPLEPVAPAEFVEPAEPAEPVESAPEPAQPVEFAAAATSRTIVMADGDVVADGPTREVCTSSPVFAPVPFALGRLSGGNIRSICSIKRVRCRARPCQYASTDPSPAASGR